MAKRPKPGRTDERPPPCGHEEQLRSQTPPDRASEATQFARFAVECAPDAIFWVAEDGRFFYANEAACRVLGYCHEDLLRLTIADIAPALTSRLWLDRWHQLKANGNLVLKTNHRAKDGRTFPVEVRANYVELGGRGYACAFARDVTERRRTEETLQVSEARFRNIANAFPLGMHMYELRKDDRLVFVGANPAADKILGMSHAAFLGKTIEEAFPGLVGTEAPARYRDAARDGVLWHTEHIDYQEGQSRGAFDVVAFQTEPGKMVAVFSDITEQKRANEALAASERNYREVFNAGSEGIFVQDRTTGAILDVNQAALEMYRCAREDALRRSITDFSEGTPPYSQQDAIRWVHKAAAEGPQLFEWRARRTNGELFWAEVNLKITPIGGHDRILAVVRDISERKRAQEAMRRLNESLEQQVAERTEDLHRTVGRLRQMTLELSQAEDRERKRIADILHEDVQQMLAGARFHLNLLAGGTCSPEESRAIIEQVRQLLRDAIERSRNLSHELSPAIYQVDFIEILDWLARHMEQKEGLIVHVEAHGQVDSPSEPLKAFLYKVAQELLFNVVKHAGVREARVRTRRMGPSIYLSIVDRGRGFVPCDLEDAGGLGLLSIQERVRLLGGHMKIRSMPGMGSRILISVPDQTISAAAPSERKPAAPRHRRRRAPDGDDRSLPRIPSPGSPKNQDEQSDAQQDR